MIFQKLKEKLKKKFFFRGPLSCTKGCISPNFISKHVVFVKLSTTAGCTQTYCVHWKLQIEIKIFFNFGSKKIAVSRKMKVRFTWYASACISDTSKSGNIYDLTPQIRCKHPIFGPLWDVSGFQNFQNFSEW